MKLKFLSFVLPSLLDCYAETVAKKIAEGRFKHPDGWLNSCIVAKDLCKVLRRCV